MVVWDVVPTPLAVVLEDVVVLEEEAGVVVVVATRVPVLLAVAAGVSGSLSIVPSALLTFDPRLFCMALLCLKTAKEERIRENDKISTFKAKTETRNQINGSTITRLCKTFLDLNLKMMGPYHKN